MITCWRPFALLFAIILSGCSTVPEVAPERSESQKQQLWSQYQEQRQKLVNWSLEGRMGLRVPGDSGSLSVEWLQKDSAYTIYLDGPLGQSIARIEGNESGVLLEASGKRHSGQNPEQLLYQLTGWDLPVSSLRYWVLGLPVPSYDAKVQLNNDGQASLISQLGWTVEYVKYKEVPEGVMPFRMKVSQGDIQVTLVVSRWLLQ